MNTLEDRLREDLSATGRAVEVSGEDVVHAHHRYRRRREELVRRRRTWTALGAAAAAAVVVGGGLVVLQEVTAPDTIEPANQPSIDRGLDPPSDTSAPGEVPIPR